MDKVVLVIGAILLFGLLVLGFSLLFAIPTMLLWNWLMPAIFGLTKITFWQAFGINFLSGLLFKSSSSCKCSSD